jgi:hypothetical protein
MAIAGVFDYGCGSGDNIPGLDELRRLIARREIDTIMTWRADHFSPALRDELRAAGCSLYSH